MTTPRARPALPILVALAIAFAMPTRADHWQNFPMTEPEVDTADIPIPLGSRYDVDNDLCQPECAYSVWIYEETNGIDGLQRGDEVVDDTCHGLIEADSLVMM